MTGSTFKRCSCPKPEGGWPDKDGKENKRCPELARKRHGSWFYEIRLDTTAGRVHLRRGGYEQARDAVAALGQVAELTALDPDPLMRAKIGDVIAAASRCGGQLPDVAAVRRRLGAGLDPASPDVTVAEWFPAWLAGKGKLKASVRRSYVQHGDHYIVRLLGEIPLAKLRAEHVAGMFATIREWNAQIEAQRAAGKALIVLDGDVRKVPQVVGNATMHRIYATLRTCLNASVRQRLIPWNPCAGVELPAEEHQEATVWGPDEAGAFLDHAESTGHRLMLLYRLVLLRGLRRGEACGLRWADADLDTGHLRISQTLMQIGGKIVTGTPKSKTSARLVSIDPETVELLRAYQNAQRRERFAAGPAYDDHGLIFADEIGRPYAPDNVSAWFKQLARAAGLPPIKLHEGRHTAAVLGLEAGLPMKVVSVQLGHSNTAITADLYTHVRRAVADDAAERVAALVPRKAAQ
jgi:integrase